MKKQIDVTDEYLNNAVPGKGRIICEDGYNLLLHEEEVIIAKWMHEHFGGDIKLLSEKNGMYGVKKPDYEWRKTYWELKTLKSEKSIDSSLRKAIGQIYDNPGGVILDFGKNPVHLSQIEKAVRSRVEASCRFKIDILIICESKLTKALRYV